MTISRSDTYPWTHPICRPCWEVANPDPDREPVTVRESYREKETCCYCGVRHLSGIYVREDPAFTPYCAHDDNVPVEELLDDPVALHTLAANLALLDPGGFR